MVLQLESGSATAETRLSNAFQTEHDELQDEILNSLAISAANGSPYSLELLLAFITDYRLAAPAIGRHVQSQAIIEEVEQEVLIAVARSIHRFRAEAKFTTWLYSLARNTAVSELRRLKQTSSIDDDQIGEAAIGTDDVSHPPVLLDEGATCSLAQRRIAFSEAEFGGEAMKHAPEMLFLLVGQILCLFEKGRACKGRQGHARRHQVLGLGAAMGDDDMGPVPLCQRRSMAQNTGHHSVATHGNEYFSQHLPSFRLWNFRRHADDAQRCMRGHGVCRRASWTGYIVKRAGRYGNYPGIRMPETTALDAMTPDEIPLASVSCPSTGWKLPCRRCSGTISGGLGGRQFAAVQRRGHVTGGSVAGETSLLSFSRFGPRCARPNSLE